jgi:hypothetical protein
MTNQVKVSNSLFVEPLDDVESQIVESWPTWEIGPWLNCHRIKCGLAK